LLQSYSNAYSFFMKEEDDNICTLRRPLPIRI
jgi:hypothetical protein